MPRSRGSASRGSSGAPRSVRLRRLRRTPSLRNWVAETDVALRRLVYPLFVRPGRGKPESIPSMPGIRRYAPPDLIPLARQLVAEGIRSVLLFGVARTKDPQGSDAWSEHGVVPEAIRALKRAAPELVVATDVCLCAYTSHGHCGIVRRGQIENDPTCDRLGRVAVAHAKAGADVVAPSAMMDGQVASIRAALDHASHEETAILAYSSKHASVFYGPFRDRGALGSLLR